MRKGLLKNNSLSQTDEVSSKSVVVNRRPTSVLFITRDESLLNHTKQSLDGYTDISQLFDEVHILILRTGVKVKNPTIRVAKNVWLYTASNKDWWRTPFVGRKLIEEQLVFADGFRPDLIIARDPFESAYLAIKLGDKYNRPVQLHILEDYTMSDWLKKDKHNYWRKFLPNYTIPKIKSIRTNTRSIFDFLKKNYLIKDLDILPRFNSYQSVIDTKKKIDLKAKYKASKFLMLYVGCLNHDCGLLKVIEAGRFGLRNSQINLVVLGEGPALRECEKRTEFLAIKKQVIFETKNKDVFTYLNSADVLIVADTDDESEDLVLRGATAGIPIVMARTARREDIFVDGESALLCERDNINEFSLKMNLLMNDLPLRKHISEMSKKMIKVKFHDDINQYLADYRDSLERVLFYW